LSARQIHKTLFLEFCDGYKFHILMGNGFPFPAKPWLAASST